MTSSIQNTHEKKKVHFFHRSDKAWIYIVLLCVVVVLLSTKGIRDEGAVSLQGDMPRYLMNGVFFCDALRDFPLSQPMKYAYQYFARYPALSLGHHPILLSIAEIPFFLVFGISVFSGKVTVLCFMLLAGIAWFLLIRSIYTAHIAFFSSLLFLTTPFVVQFSRKVLSEIPALALIIVATYLFYQYCQSNKTKYLYATAVALFLSILTRYQAILMVPIFLGYFLVTKQPKNLFTKKNLLACFIIILLLFPLIFLLSKYAPTQIRWLTQKSLSSRFAISNVTYHLKALWESHLTLPVLILSIFSICISAFRKDKRTLLFLLWIIGYYMQITLIGATNAQRYSMYWIPAFCLLAAISIEFFDHRIWKILCTGMLVIISGYQFAIAFQMEPEYAAGYEQAAKYVVEHKKGETVMFNANVDTGYFVFFVRKYDPDKKMIVLRSDKILATSRLSEIVEERITRKEQIYEILKDFGTAYVVIEDKKFTSPPLEWLREEVKTDKFILRKQIPIRSNSNKLKNVSLGIYEYKGYTSAKQEKVMHMNIPLMDGSIELRLDELL